MKRYTSIIFQFTIIVFLSCSQEINQPKNDESSNKIQIRIANKSEFRFTNLSFGNGFCLGNYNSVLAGELTDYFGCKIAYNSSSLHLNIGAWELHRQVIDYVGEEPLPNGQYTLEIYAVQNGTYWNDKDELMPLYVVTDKLIPLID